MLKQEKISHLFFSTFSQALQRWDVTPYSHSHFAGEVLSPQFSYGQNRCHRQATELGFKVPGHLTKVWVYFLYSTLPGIRDIEAELQRSQVLVLHQQRLV